MTNNVFILADAEPVARFSKAVDYNISGMRLDLEGKPLDFLLTTKMPGQFEYDEEVVELYSDRELRYFKNANRYLLNNGLVKPYENSREAADSTQVLNDEEIAHIVALRTAPAIAKRIEDIMTVATMNRVLGHAEEVGLSIKAMEVIKKRIQALQNTEV